MADVAEIAHEEIEDVEFPDDSHATSTGISNPKLAMWVYLASDALLFGGLISTYLIYKNRPGEIPGLAGSQVRPNELFDIPFTSMTTFILLMSSLTMVMSVTSAMRNDQVRMRLWLGTTALLGALFLGGQIYEFTVFVSEGLGYTTNVSSSAFYTLTGFHGVHVALGILMLVAMLGMSLRQRIHAEAVEVIGLYWHFVDIVWVVIFTIVYLIP